jgi:hypothetical protein
LGGLLVRLVLVLAMVWLPMGGLMAMPIGVAHQAEDSVVSHHHQHQQNPLLQTDKSVTSATGDTMPQSCAGHMAPCCSACISFYAPSPLVLLPFTLFEIDRWQPYSVSISVIVLPRDIRPPIA